MYFIFTVLERMLEILGNERRASCQVLILFVVWNYYSFVTD